MALTTVALVKARLGIAATSTAQDALLTEIVAEADSTLKNYLGQNVEQATYTEYYLGNGRRELLLRQLPVMSITSIALDADGYFGYGENPFATGDLLTAGVDYALDRSSNSEGSGSGIVYRINAVWPAASEFSRNLLTTGIAAATGNIKVVYVAGYSSVPKRFQAWATRLACWKYATDSRGVAMQSESHSDSAYSYSVGDLKGMNENEVLKSITGGAREFVL